MYHFGAVWGAKCVHGQWSPEQLAAAKRKDTLNIPYLELLSVALALCTWGPLLTRKKLTIECDADTAVKALQGRSCADTALMHLIRTILWLAARIYSHCAAFTFLVRRTCQSTFSLAAMCRLSGQLFQSTNLSRQQLRRFRSTLGRVRP
jgi:hypothetical protein